MKVDTALHRIGNDIVAAYLVITPEGVTVIDAGLSGHWKDLLVELAAVGKQVSDIKGVVLTHGDSDHVGFAERLRRDFGVPVYLHPADGQRAMGGPKPKNARSKVKVGPLLSFVFYLLSKGGVRTRWLSDTVAISDGDVLDLPGSPRIIEVPGHSLGSVAVAVPSVDAVFVGDALTTRNVLTGAEGPQPAPFTDDPRQAIASLQRIVSTGAKWVLPGHGAPWGGGVVSAVAAVEQAFHGRAGGSGMRD